MKKVRFGSLQPDVEDILDWNNYTPGDFEAANSDEKASFIADRKSVGYWADAWRRLRKNKVAMVAAVILILIVLFAFVGPLVVPYGYEQFNKGAENLHPWHYSYEDQTAAKAMVAERSMDPEEVVAKAVAEAQAQGRTLSNREIAVIRAQAKAGTDGKGSLTEVQALEELGAKTRLFGYSYSELERKANGESVFPHVFGTDGFGRDIMVGGLVGTHFGRRFCRSAGAGDRSPLRLHLRLLRRQGGRHHAAGGRRDLRHARGIGHPADLSSAQRHPDGICQQ